LFSAALELKKHILCR